MNLPWTLLAVVLAFAGGAVVGEWDGARRVDLRWTARTERAGADATAAARTVEITRFRNMEGAYRAHQLDLQRLRADNQRARAAAGRLRDDLAAADRRLPADAGPAVLDAFAACRTVLGECGERYRDVAAAADEHAADARLCVDAWPR